MTTIFDPLQLGDLHLRNRIIMALMTRFRAGPKRIPNALMVEYYRQLASAGLIISEAVTICPKGVGYPATPGILSGEQQAGWKRVTRAVHEAGGHIYIQLWHVGHISDPYYLNGELPVAPSAIAVAGQVSMVLPNKPYVTPRPLETDDIAGIVESYRKATEDALSAGFDGVEMHAGNDYLLDQFLQSGSNKRTDQYGGQVEIRGRLLLEAAEAAISVWGASRVGVHLAPRGDAHSMSDSNPEETFGYVARELNQRKIAFLFIRESLEGNRLGPALTAAFCGVYIANEGFTKKTANEILTSNEADAVAWEKLFIANPDLPRSGFITFFS